MKKTGIESIEDQWKSISEDDREIIRKDIESMDVQKFYEEMKQRLNDKQYSIQDDTELDRIINNLKLGKILDNLRDQSRWDMLVKEYCQKYGKCLLVLELEKNKKVETHDKKDSNNPFDNFFVSTAALSKVEHKKDETKEKNWHTYYNNYYGKDSIFTKHKMKKFIEATKVNYARHHNAVFQKLSNKIKMNE